MRTRDQLSEDLKSVHDKLRSLTAESKRREKKGIFESHKETIAYLLALCCAIDEAIWLSTVLLFRPKSWRTLVGELFNYSYGLMCCLAGLTVLGTAIVVCSGIHYTKRLVGCGLE